MWVSQEHRKPDISKIKLFIFSSHLLPPHHSHYAPSCKEYYKLPSNSKNIDSFLFISSHIQCIRSSMPGFYPNMFLKSLYFSPSLASACGGGGGELSSSGNWICLLIGLPTPIFVKLWYFICILNSCHYPSINPHYIWNEIQSLLHELWCLHDNRFLLYFFFF